MEVLEGFYVFLEVVSYQYMTCSQEQVVVSSTGRAMLTLITMTLKTAAKPKSNDHQLHGARARDFK